MPKRRVTDADRDRGKRIRQAYIQAGFRRKEFAELLDRYYHDVTRLEQGQKPEPETLTRIAEICSVTERWLVRGPIYSPEFQAWLQSSKPDDLHDVERELLAAINFPAGHHPGKQWYSLALEAWRMGTRSSLLEKTHVRKLVR